MTCPYNSSEFGGIARGEKAKRMKVYPDDWRIRLCGAAGGMAGGAIGLFVLMPLIEFPPWLGGITFISLIGVGVFLGQVVGSRLFPPSSGGPPSA
jgi:hypothetical protein